MRINHVHFYVHDAEFWRDWFIRVFNFCSVRSYVDRLYQTRTEVVQQASLCFLLSSPLSHTGPIAEYLQLHPAGVVDVAFEVEDLESILARVLAPVEAQIQVGEDRQSPNGIVAKFCQIQGWGDLKHTLIQPITHPDKLYESSEPGGAVGAERAEGAEEAAGALREASLAPLPVSQQSFYLSVLAPEAVPLFGALELDQDSSMAHFVAVDHVVLNVAAGDLQRSIAFYQRVFGLQCQQRFKIQTQHSALSSQVLVDSTGEVQLPINEPASAQSQIQEFLNENRGAGVQHIALRTVNAIAAIAQLRQQGLSFLSVPLAYYEQLQHRLDYPLSEAELRSIARHEVLVDWQLEKSQALLLQAFTHPIFPEPTFFFEIIERRQYWTGDRYQSAQGFGEGNFQALFEAIEREQVKRGSLDQPLE